jgi:hypothetical protein
MSKRDDEWFHKHFPTARARDAADKAIDKMDVAEPMHAFLDAWVAAYRVAGGLTSYDWKTDAR